VSPRAQAYPVLAAALDRHLGWAHEFASAGDLESAGDAIRDAESTFDELFTCRTTFDLRSVTMAPMNNHAIISELQAISDAASRALAAEGSEAELIREYGALRARATSLALEHGLSTPEHLRDQFPSEEALREIERLDHAFGTQASPALPADRGLSARVQEALTEVAGWATGARLAFETLENDAERRR
jgi:hypothetical protein